VTVTESRLDIVRDGFEAAARGDLAAVAALLDEDVTWHEAGYDDAGCHNRAEALRWMSEGVARGVALTPVETRPLADGRVLILLQRGAPTDGDGVPPLHGQILGFRGDKITEIVFFPTAEAALGAAGLA
jgi:ketosteroid isomerase-like protein